VADIAEAMDASGAPTNRMLETSGISPSVRENRLGFVPGRCVWAFVDEYSRRSDRREFLFEMARQSNWRRARWATGMTQCVTLGDALLRMGSGWTREIPMNRMGLTLNESVAWFWRCRTTEVRGWVGNESAEQYCLSFMLEVIRAAAGPQWQPTGVMLESSPFGWGAVSPALDGVTKWYRGPQLAVAFPRRLLALPVSIQPLLDNYPAAEPAARDFQGSLRQVLRESIAGGLPGQTEIAERLGTSGRSLRRRLAEEGHTWRSVVNELKFALAHEQLMRGVPAGEVAEQLGYSDPAHFARFFVSRTGVAPSRWREHADRAAAEVGSGVSDHRN
jgi:AraC-like DNA-binding protein